MSSVPEDDIAQQVILVIDHIGKRGHPGDDRIDPEIVGSPIWGVVRDIVAHWEPAGGRIGFVREHGGTYDYCMYYRPPRELRRFPAAKFHDTVLSKFWLPAFADPELVPSLKARLAEFYAKLRGGRLRPC